MKSNTEIIRDYLAGERPITIVGYKAPDEKPRLVGEQWTDAKGREWIQKAGGPVRVNKLDAVRAELIDKCSACGCEIRWGGRHDRKFFAKTGKCFDCLIKEETMLRIKGQYHLYEQQKVLKNQRAYLLDVRKKLREAFDYTKEHKVITYVNSNGLVEEWTNDARDDLLKSLKKDFVTCLKTIREVESALTEVTTKINSVMAESNV